MASCALRNSIEFLKRLTQGGLLPSIIKKYCRLNTCYISFSRCCAPHFVHSLLVVQRSSLTICYLWGRQNWYHCPESIHLPSIIHCAIKIWLYNLYYSFRKILNLDETSCTVRTIRHLRNCSREFHAKKMKGIKFHLYCNPSEYAHKFISNACR